MNRNLYIFNQEYAFENVVCKMTAILSRSQYVTALSLDRNDKSMLPRPKWHDANFDLLRLYKMTKLQTTRIMMKQTVSISI